MKKIYVLALTSLLSLGAFAQDAKLNLAESKGGVTSAQIVVTPGMEDLSNEQLVDIYSYNNNIFINPINFNNLEGVIEVYDLGGKLVASQNLTNNLIQLELPRTGMYIVSVNAGGKVFTEKVFLK